MPHIGVFSLQTNGLWILVTDPDAGRRVEKKRNLSLWIEEAIVGAEVIFLQIVVGKSSRLLLASSIRWRFRGDLSIPVSITRFDA